MTPACNGYWINVQAYTPTAPAAYQCLTKAEYDAFNAQHAAASQSDGHLFLIAFTIACGIAFLIAAPLIGIKRFRR